MVNVYYIFTACWRKRFKQSNSQKSNAAHLFLEWSLVFYIFIWPSSSLIHAYRPICFSFFQVLQACLLHIIQKGRYIVSNYNSAFFRAEHNASEMEAYCSALCQLRALLHLAQQLINDNECGQLYSLQDRDLSRKFVQEYSSMHKACFYGRCLGFQVSRQKLHVTVAFILYWHV